APANATSAAVVRRRPPPAMGAERFHAATPAADSRRRGHPVSQPRSPSVTSDLTLTRTSPDAITGRLACSGRASHATRNLRTCALAAPPTLAGQGRPRALDAAPLLLPARGRRAAARALTLPGPHAVRARPPPRGLPRSPASRVVPADLAEEPHLCRGGAGLPLVARHRRALVGATSAHPQVRGARLALEGAPGEAAREAPPHAAAAAERDAHEVPGGVAALPEGEPSRPEPRPERGGAAALRRGRRPLAP